MRYIGGLLVVLLLVGCTATGDSRRTLRPRPYDRVAAAYGAYLVVYDRVSAAGGEGVQALEPLVSPQQYVLERARADLLRLGGYSTRGHSIFETLATLATLTIRVCLDTSHVRTFDASGTDITTGPTRRPYVITYVHSEVPPFTLLLEGVDPSEPPTC